MREAQISALHTMISKYVPGRPPCVEEACFLCLRNSCANWKEFEVFTVDTTTKEKPFQKL